MSETHSLDPSDSAMFCEDSLAVLAHCRRENHIVITNQSSARIWPTLCRHPLDFNYLSSTMGGAVPLGLGLALARPDCEVIVVSGDGSLLMNLGCLVSVTASGVTNLTILLLVNGLYEVTGGQRTPGSQAQLDYSALARATGFRTVAHFSDLEVWQSYAVSGWETAGPRFFSLRVRPIKPETPRCTTTRVDQELQRLRATLLVRPLSEH